MTSYHPCIIIPVYNHHRFIDTTLQKTSSKNLAVILVNDGSTQECVAVLQDVVDRYQGQITLIHLNQNQGKGGAVIAGFKEAFRQGFTHALQIDADGQHNTDDIEKFISQSQSYPNDIICGQPMYDASVPKGRLYGRYITHFWVWVETLSFDIKDSMCGFRVYPLDKTITLLETTDIGKRMDFDIEILVRLYWKGVKIQNVETKVIYPEDGISHFKMFKDNVRISKMHTRLFFGMIWRLPILLRRKFVS